ncbi:hypothetical protein C7M84_018854 [Penaeus vannamei]|uniref:Uncharacterized protein n=1 Tax=Penaeus vannamei TaxID=6689 RepID=A0A3R7SJ68_PENVA|nr:hypothetical protein C7M84_018854 [Penaeus vannamei]
MPLLFPSLTRPSYLLLLWGTLVSIPTLDGTSRSSPIPPTVIYRFYPLRLHQHSFADLGSFPAPPHLVLWVPTKYVTWYPTPAKCLLIDVFSRLRLFHPVSHFRIPVYHFLPTFESRFPCSPSVLNLSLLPPAFPQFALAPLLIPTFPTLALSWTAPLRPVFDPLHRRRPPASCPVNLILLPFTPLDCPYLSLVRHLRLPLPSPSPSPPFPSVVVICLMFCSASPLFGQQGGGDRALCHRQEQRLRVGERASGQYRDGNRQDREWTGISIGWRHLKLRPRRTHKSCAHCYSMTELRAGKEPSLVFGRKQPDMEGWPLGVNIDLWPRSCSNASVVLITMMWPVPCLFGFGSPGPGFPPPLGPLAAHILFCSSPPAWPPSSPHSRFHPIPLPSPHYHSPNHTWIISGPKFV